MKQKMLKKLMILGLAFSMAVSMAPVPVRAAESDTQTEQSDSTESETKEPETKQSETKEPETKEPETKQTETKEPETKQKETKQSETKEPETKKTDSEKTSPSDKTAKSNESIIEGGEEGTDYTYDTAAQTLTIKTEKPMTVKGSEIKKIVIETAKTANLILSDLTITNAADAGIQVEENGKLNLTLKGANKIDTKGAGIVLGANASLAIAADSTGVLEAKVADADVSAIKMDSTNSVLFAGGTIKGALLKTEKAKVSVTGGSLNVTKVEGELRDGKNTLIYKATVPTAKKSTAVTSLKVLLDNQEYSYGSKGILADENGNVYLCLPAGTAKVNVDGAISSGTISATAGTLTKVDASLTVTAPIFDEVSYGYTQPQAKAIKIENAGSETDISNVQITSGGENFTLTPSDDKKVPAEGSNEKYTIQPKAGLAAGTYSVSITVSYLSSGVEKQAAASVSFIVKKVQLTASVDKVDEKVYDGTTEGSGTLKLSGAVGDEKPAATAKFTYNSKNVSTAKEVKITDIKLADEWAKNYELTNTTIDSVEAKIKKAPNPYADEKPKAPSVKVIFNSEDNKWQPQMTTYEGQEYLFVVGKSTKLTDKNKTSKNWAYGKSDTVKSREIPLSLKEDTTYTVFTRFAGDENHETGETSAYANFKVEKKAKTYTGSDNKITGISAGTTYKTGSTITFTAVGAGMDNTSPNEGDERYVPISWKVSDKHEWSGAPYTGSFSVKTSGTNTLDVTFKKQSYNGKNWEDLNKTSTTKLNFRTSTSGTVQPGTGTSNNNNGTSAKNNKAAKTADTSPIMPLGILFAGSGLLLAGYSLKRRRIQ